MSSPVSLTESKANDLLEVLSGTFAESESKDFSETTDESECAENYGYHSDSDIEDDDDAVNAGETLKKMVTLRGHPFDPLCFPLSARKSIPTYGEHKERLEKGKVIKIQDMALIT